MRVLSIIVCCLLLLPLSFAAHEPSHNTTPIPPGFEEQPDIIIEIRELHRVREVGRITNQPSLQVLGTDYLTFDNGKLQSYLTQGGFPIDNAACFVSVLYPNMSHFIDNVLMQNANTTNFEGLYFHDFNVPNATGVYPVNSHCFYNVTGQRDLVNAMFGNFTVTGGSLDDLDRIDQIPLEFTGQNDCNNVQCNQSFNFSLPAGFDDTFLTDFRLIVLAETSNNAFFNVSVFDHNSTSYVQLYSFDNADPDNGVQQQFNLNTTMVTPDNMLTVVFSSGDFDNNKLEIDHMILSRTYNGTIVSDLRGNSELVVSKKLDNATNQILAPDIIFEDSDLILILLFLIMGALLIAQIFFGAGVMSILVGLFAFEETNLKILFMLFGVLLWAAEYYKKDR